MLIKLFALRCLLGRSLSNSLMTNMLQNKLKPIKNNYENYHPAPDASVLLALNGSQSSPNLVLTRRAAHLKSHAGQVSLPGGKSEIIDTGPADTALRETEEEIALPRDQVLLMGELPDQMSLGGLRVKPIVGWVDELPELTPCLDELDAIFQVPLEFFLADNRLRTDVYPLFGKELWSPSWQYEDFEIWGLTARIVVDLLKFGYGADLDRTNAAPERVLS